MTTREEKISLHLWNYYRRDYSAYVQRLSYIFGSTGKVLSAFQRGVADYLRFSPINIRIAYNRLETDILTIALNHGDSRIAREEDIYRWKMEELIYSDTDSLIHPEGGL